MNNNELLNRIRLIAVYILALAALSAIFSCAAAPTGGGITPWGASDLCQREPTNPWCEER